VRQTKTSDLRNLNQEELEAKLKQLREDQFNFRFRNSVQQLDDPLKLRGVRRDIARVRTIQNERRKGIHPAAGR
jgi:large subunit ribosomal protein L29